MDTEREERIRRFKEKVKIKCIHCVFDGTGNYYGLKPMGRDYPHKFLRLDCYGRYHNCKFPELYKEN